MQIRSAVLSVPLRPVVYVRVDPKLISECGECFRVMWTGEKDDAFFRLESEDSTTWTITWQEGLVTQKRSAKIEATLKDWKTTTALLAEFLERNTADEELKDWFTSSHSAWPSPFARLVEATVVSARGGHKPWSASDTLQKAYNERMLRLPSDVNLPDLGRREVDRRRMAILEKRMNARTTARRRMKCLLKAYEIRNGEVIELKVLGCHQIKGILGSALEHFHIGYHSWRQYGDSKRDDV